MSDVPLELTLLALLARTAHDAESIADVRCLARSRCHTQRLLDLATAHEVLPLVHEVLLHHPVPEIPAALMPHLQQRRAEQAAGELAALGKWIRLRAAFDAAEIPAVSIGGFEDALHLYGRSGLRRMSRVLCVVRDGDLARATQVVELQGLSGHVTLLTAVGPLVADTLIRDAQRPSPDIPGGATGWLPSAEHRAMLTVVLGNEIGWATLASLVDVEASFARLTPAQRDKVRAQLAGLGLQQALATAETTLADLRQIAPTPAQRRRAHGEVETACTFVTAIYDNGPASLIGGRGRGLQYFVPSLANIANLGAPIVVYCPAKDASLVSSELAEHFSRWEVIAYELTNFPNAERFLAWKQTYVAQLQSNLRNELLCFQKSYWLQDVIRRNPFDHERFYWIDAGLTHHGIFPERVGGVELQKRHPDERYHPLSETNIFRPALAQALLAATPEDRVLFCALPYNGAAELRLRYEDVAANLAGRRREDVTMSRHLVGGLFGGSAAAVTRLHHDYARLLESLIEARVYTLEEQVFSALYATAPEHFELLHFGTWWFYAPEQPNSQLERDGDSFYKIFTRLLDASGSATAAE